MAHVHSPLAFGRAFKLGIALNTGYVMIEAVCGVVFNSLALLSDAGHNLGDVLALALAWGAAWLSTAATSERRTYGMKRATVLASLVSAVLLCLALGAIVWESLARLDAPPPASGLTIVVVAGIGVAINAFTAWLFMAGRHRDLNVRSAYLHMAADAAVSLGVVLAGLAIFFTGWLWLDPAVALALAGVILLSAFGLLRESLDLAMDAVPRHVDAAEVREYLQSLPAVRDVHHLHIWGMSTTETALTVHLVVDEAQTPDALLQSIADELHARFRIQHPTVQLEAGRLGGGCVFVAGQRGGGP